MVYKKRAPSSWTGTGYTFSNLDTEYQVLKGKELSSKVESRQQTEEDMERIRGLRSKKKNRYQSSEARRRAMDETRKWK